MSDGPDAAPEATQTQTPTQTPTDDRFRRDLGRRLERAKDVAFEALLAGATLLGLVSLAILFGYVANDAIRPATAPAAWYLLVLGALIAPLAGYGLLLRRRPAARLVNARAMGTFVGSLALALAVYVVADALNPFDVLYFLLFAAGPPLLVLAAARRVDLARRRLVGPSLPVAVVVGLALGTLLYGVVRPLFELFFPWVAYFVLVAVPVAAALALLAGRHHGRRAGLLVGAGAGLAPLAVAGIAIASGLAPGLSVTLVAGVVVPTAYVMAEPILVGREGRLGALGPLVLVGSIGLLLALSRALAIPGPDGYLTSTLLLNSWDGLNPAEAGVYPQIVGSIVIVSVMAVLAFPVGIGAAVYLEEYAPQSGLGGRLATVLEVNIANLAGVPSVVYGLLGLALFRNALGLGPGVVVAAAGTLGLLILPIVVVSAQEAIRAVPGSTRRAAYGMGASRWQTLRDVVLPAAVPGTLTGTILALARAIGETAPLIIVAVATTKYTPPDGLFASATALPLQIYAARSNVDPAFRHGVVPAAVIVLLVLMIAMNAGAVLVRNRYDRMR